MWDWPPWNFFWWWQTHLVLTFSTFRKRVVLQTTWVAVYPTTTMPWPWPFKGYLCYSEIFQTKILFWHMMAESLDTSELVPDEDDRKLFVGGLPQVIHCCHLLEFLHSHHWHSLQDARQEDISAHFQTFGEIDNINIKTDPATGRSRWDWIITTFIEQVTPFVLQRVCICCVQNHFKSTRRC